MSTLTLSQRTQQLPRQHPKLFLLTAALVWLALYQALSPASEALVAALPVDRDSHLGGALQFGIGQHRHPEFRRRGRKHVAGQARRHQVVLDNMQEDQALDRRHGLVRVVGHPVPKVQTHLGRAQPDAAGHPGAGRPHGRVDGAIVLIHVAHG